MHFLILQRCCLCVFWFKYVIRLLEFSFFSKYLFIGCFSNIIALNRFFIHLVIMATAFKCKIHLLGVSFICCGVLHDQEYDHRLEHMITGPTHFGGIKCKPEV